MSSVRRRRGGSPLAARHSLRLRLPLVISALLVAVVATFLWAAYRQVEDTLARAGGERAKSAADQVANLFGPLAHSGMQSLRQATEDGAIRHYLQNPTDADAREAARVRLAPLAAEGGARRVQLWSATGALLLDIAVRAATGPGAAPVLLPAPTRVPPDGFSPIQVVGSVVFTDTAAEIAEKPLSHGAAIARLGSLAVRSTLAVNPPGVLGRLVGTDAVVQIGNTAGGIWTDLSSVVPPPPVDLTHNGIAEYRAANGERRLGAVSTIGGTPWAVWVEFPRSTMVAPARAFLRRMTGVATIFVAVSALLVWNLSIRITNPIHDLVQASDEIAAGDYSQRVTTRRRDEIGRLGRAFNSMASDVEDAHQQLEAQVLERTRALDALRASEAHYRAIVEVALDCIITIDAAGQVLEFNPAAVKTFGYRKRDAVGRELAELIVPPAYRDAHRKGLARFIATGTSTLIGRRVEMTAMRSDGTEFPVELAISAVPSGGSPILTGVARDLTDRRHMEEVRLKTQEMEQQHRRMAEANRLKSEFLANMSHELRTPLNAIIGFAELMHRGKVGPVSEEHEEYLGDILTASRHLLQLINDVLDLAKVESGKMEFRPEVVDLAQLTNEVLDTLRVLAANQALRIESQVHPDVTAAVIDPERVKQILYNYVSNAIKFTPAGGEVCVRIMPEGRDMFRIDVEDTGVGIAAGDIAKLFVEFQQLDAGTTKRHQGTGLGLALIKRLVEAQGGRVTVRSTPGEGSTFSAILPRRMTIAPVDDVIPVIAPLSSNRTVLVVDDDPATLKLADIALRELGHRPMCRDNAVDALLAVEADPPALVVVDLLMPHMDGFEFISRLRAFPGGHDVPVVVWTVKDLDAGERHRLHAVATAIVSKSAGGSHALVQELKRLMPRASDAPEGSDGA